MADYSSSFSIQRLKPSFVYIKILIFEDFKAQELNVIQIQIPDMYEAYEMKSTDDKFSV